MKATGRDMQLTRQIGEHLVAAELGRRGYIATPFAGNIPMFDLLVANKEGQALPIQVKAIRGASWQFNARAFLEIEMIGDEQKVLGKSILQRPDLLCIFVLVQEEGSKERDQFFIFQLRDLQDHFFGTYKGGRRPKNPLSMHCAIWPESLKRYRDNWDLVRNALESKDGIRGN